ncbi:Histone deacetylase 9, partial [Tetrabaena socialis]
AAGSILAARDLASGACDVAVHWGGGMHHGMPYRAFGFCYVNDLVLAVLELMAVCGRVLYIDIDVHHGDGVLSISLHKWDDGRMQAAAGGSGKGGQGGGAAAAAAAVQHPPVPYIPGLPTIMPYKPKSGAQAAAK